MQELFSRQNCDYEHSKAILERINRGYQAPTEGGLSFPASNDPRIIDLTAENDLVIPKGHWEAFLKQGNHPWSSVRGISSTGPQGQQIFTKTDLRHLGLLLLPYTAYGVLNGGSATSFVDHKKNQSFCPEVFPVYEKLLQTVEHTYQGKPKGITPAFITSEGGKGPSFIELKVRDILNQCLEYQKIFGPLPQYPAFFQMTSEGTHAAVGDYLSQLPQSPYIAPLLEELGWTGLHFRTAKQELIATFTLPDQQGQSDFFVLGPPESPKLRPLPGGHGQNFRVLQGIYQNLHQEGYLYAYLGNVDNIGYTPNLEAMARLQLAGAQGGFEFSYRTPMDVKGGVLVQNERGVLSTKDLGVSISHEAADNQEKSGGPVLFNCATGLFDLSYLNQNLERIIAHLPLRISKQDKDIGQYLQAEQVTWEVMELMEDVMIFGIDKSHRFLSAKLLMETFLTSGLYLEDVRWQLSDRSQTIQKQALKNHQGLKAHLEHISKLDAENFKG
jgi:UTP--glucose-1-phosphate uridylyltransferase